MILTRPPWSREVFGFSRGDDALIVRGGHDPALWVADFVSLRGESGPRGSYSASRPREALDHDGRRRDAMS